jgi:hypothetical protein
MADERRRGGRVTPRFTLTAAEFQPQGDVRVCLDPAGHPFCLWVRE